MKKILVLGASSFAGSSFFQFLYEKFNYNLLGTYNSKKNLNKLFSDKNILNKLVKLDLNIQNSKLLKIVNKFKPEFIFDFASVCMVNESWADPKYYFNVNVNSKLELINSLHKMNFLKKFIYISTPEVFGSNNNFVKENNQIFNPSTPYALSKLVCEKNLTNYNNFIKKKSIITRFSNFYGLRQLKHRLIPKMIDCINSNKKFPLQGKGLTKRNFLFEDDFNEGLVKVMNRGKNGETYHFSSNDYFTIKEVVSLICKFYRVNFKDVVYLTKDRIGKDKNYFLHSEYTKKKLKWKPKYNLRRGLIKMIEYHS
jgi:dTDP-glucose 4,6-dehydratase